MAYMIITNKTDTHLQLHRQPSFMSKIIFSGFVVGVLGVLVYGSDTLMFKTLIAFSSMIISSFIVDNYETFDINKQVGNVLITRMHFCQYLMNRFLATQPYTTCNVSDIQEVRVADQDEGGKTKMHRVVLVLKSGIHLGVTEVFTNDSESEHQKIAEIISSFIGVDNKVIDEKTEDNLDIDDVDVNQVGNDTDSSSSDEDKLLEDGFEKITQAEIDKIEVKKEQEKLEGGDKQEVSECGDTLPCDKADTDNEKEKQGKEIPSEVESQPS